MRVKVKKAIAAVAQVIPAIATVRPVAINLNAVNPDAQSAVDHIDGYSLKNEGFAQNFPHAF